MSGAVAGRIHELYLRAAEREGHPSTLELGRYMAERAAHIVAVLEAARMMQHACGLSAGQPCPLCGALRELESRA